MQILFFLLLISLCLSKVCIFDIDATLTRSFMANSSLCGPNLPDHTYQPSTYGKESIKRCREMGYGVAIVTAAKSFINKGRENFILEMLGEADRGFFDTCAFQQGSSDKKRGMQNILNCFNTTSECSILFDDTY